MITHNMSTRIYSYVKKNFTVEPDRANRGNVSFCVECKHLTYLWTYTFHHIFRRIINLFMHYSRTWKIARVTRKQIRPNDRNDVKFTSALMCNHQRERECRELNTTFIKAGYKRPWPSLRASANNGDFIVRFNLHAPLSTWPCPVPQLRRRRRWQGAREEGRGGRGGGKGRLRAVHLRERKRRGLSKFPRCRGKA